MEMIIGMIGALVGVGLFVFGFFLGKEAAQPKKVDPVQPTDDELHRIKAERERMIAEQEAFREMLNYNADVAYGVTGTKL